jgi:transcriptional regulator with XRE-family HTH domain
MQTIGERLEEARKRKSVSLREAAEATKIRGDYLQKFESNQFNIGLTDIYIRGFLRNYAQFLGLPAERMVSDYENLGHSEPKPRTPSREVYGRMELSVSTHADRAAADNAGPEAAGPAGADPLGSPRPSLRPHASGLPPETRINPALAFKGLFILAGIAGILVLFFLAKAVFGGSRPAAESNASAAQAAATAAAAETQPAVTLIALQPVAVRVFRQADSVEIFNEQMTANEHKEFPNEGLIVTASALESVQFEFKGSRYRFAAKGRTRGVIEVQK